MSSESLAVEFLTTTEVTDKGQLRIRAYVVERMGRALT